MQRPGLAGLATLAACIATPPIVSDYGSEVGVNHRTRRGPHPGIDFAGTLGDPVIAPMDGVVLDVSNSPDSAGRCLVLRHPLRDRDWFTLYCHLDRVVVAVGDVVARGAPLGAMGASGAGAGGIVHLHFQLCTRPCTTASFDGELDSTRDPAAFTIGCFDPLRSYDRGALQLTYPVECW